MKILLKDYFVVGSFEQKSVFIKNDYQLPYYMSKKDIETKTGGMRVPVGVTFVITIMIRSIDSKNLQPNPLLLLIGFVIVYLSVERMVRKYAEQDHEVNKYYFENDTSLLQFIKENQKRNNMMLMIFIILLFFTILFGILYFLSHSFIFLLFSVLSFFCFALWSKYQIFKRMFVLYKIKKELIR